MRPRQDETGYIKKRDETETRPGSDFHTRPRVSDYLVLRLRQDQDFCHPVCYILRAFSLNKCSQDYLYLTTCWMASTDYI